MNYRRAAKRRTFQLALGWDLLSNSIDLLAQYLFISIEFSYRAKNLENSKKASKFVFFKKMAKMNKGDWVRTQGLKTEELNGRIAQLGGFD